MGGSSLWSLFSILDGKETVEFELQISTLHLGHHEPSSESQRVEMNYKIHCTSVVPAIGEAKAKWPQVCSSHMDNIARLHVKKLKSGKENDFHSHFPNVYLLQDLLSQEANISFFHFWVAD